MSGFGAPVRPAVWLAALVLALSPGTAGAVQDVHQGAFSLGEKELAQVLKLSAEARVMNLSGLGESLVAVGHGEIKGSDRAAITEAQRAAEADAKGHMTEFIHGLKTETREEVKTLEKVVSILSGGEAKDQVQVEEEYTSFVRTRSRGALRGVRMLAAWSSDDGSLRTVAVVFSKKFLEAGSPTAGLIREGENSLKSKALEGQRAIRSAGVVSLAGGDAGSAREQALVFARENAVREGLGSLVQSQTVVDEASTKIKIREKAFGYIIEENVVSEGPEGDFYRVTLDAIVSLELLDKDLRAFRLLQEQVGMPRVAVRLTESWEDGGSGTGAASSQLRELLQEQGYQLVTASTADAEVAIEGTCTLSKSGQDKFGRYRVHASTDYKAVVVSTGKLLASAQDRQRVAQKTLDGASSQAAKRATRLTFKKLHTQIVDQWSNIARSGDTFTVVLADVTSYRSQGRGFEKLMASVEGVSSAKKRSFEGGTLILDVQFRGGASDLEEAIFTGLDASASAAVKKIDFRSSQGNRLEFYCQP